MNNIQFLTPMFEAVKARGILIGGGILLEGFARGYERNGVYSVEEVASKLGQEDADFDGDKISITAHRYLVFARSLTCVRCGTQGLYFAKERSARKGKNRGEPIRPILSQHFQAKWHLNLYTLNKDGFEVLMTKDHVIPQSKGGLSEMSNYQTMCSPCNCWKGSQPQEIVKHELKHLQEKI